MTPLEPHSTKLSVDNQCIILAMSGREQKKHGSPHAPGGVSPGFKGQEELYPIEKTENSLCDPHGCWYPR
ncbi:MAG: hypothetical protein ACT4OL_05475, partial [Nitrospiraceae bacterium]